VFRKLFRSLQQDEIELRDASITEWAKATPGVVLMRDAENREMVKLAGVVERIRVKPQDGTAAYEVAVSDGTGRVRVIWLGRRTIPGLELGLRMVVEGRLGEDEKGRKQILNPTYEFEASTLDH
jgi:RecG-like helicase